MENVTSTKSQVIRLFIVEDYHLTRMGLMAVLGEFPQIQFIGEAESAEEGLSKLEQNCPDILLLDLGLPGMNGIDMAQEVRKRYPDVKIVILTSHSEEQEVIAALGAGANAYVLKDVKPERLVHIIETVQDGAVWLDPAIASLVLTLVNDPAALAQQKRQIHQAENPSMESDLTERELEVLQLIVEGKSNPEIAEQLCISIHTAKAHVGSILNKLCVNDRVQAAIKALKENIV
ncbi:response regulator [Vampirovibrio chlorellavorus]|uniref:response regulator n=1 Tax=Vampirovibrio chlorellavorus TaxID=758823 RepID=UPI0026EFBDA6|nr:response regulator transcription factor [Vampirovibrio chlorellavorus]